MNRRQLIMRAAGLAAACVGWLSAKPMQTDLNFACVDRTPELIPCLVYLDGIRVGRAVTANAAEGWVDVREIEAGDIVRRHRLYGQVCIKRTNWNEMRRRSLGA